MPVAQTLTILYLLQYCKILSILSESELEMWTNAYSREDVGAFLKEARRERGISQKQMAAKLGFSPVTLSALETGKNVSTEKVERYLQMLGFRIVILPKTASIEVRE